jgi:hypothetical protein
MELEHLQPENSDQLNKKEQKAVDHFNELIDALNDKEIDETTENYIKERISIIKDNVTFNTIKKEESKILDFVNKELGYLAQNHYMSLWIALGMSAFGVPLGVAIGLALDQLGFMGIGIAVGLAIGVGVGSSKDKEAKKQGKQLPVTK